MLFGEVSVSVYFGKILPSRNAELPDRDQLSYRVVDDIRQCVSCRKFHPNETSVTGQVYHGRPMPAFCRRACTSGHHRTFRQFNKEGVSSSRSFCARAVLATRADLPSWACCRSVALRLFLSFSTSTNQFGDIIMTGGNRKNPAKITGGC